MKTGIVIEIHGRTAVVLQPDGAFIEQKALPGWDVGRVVGLAVAHRPKAVLFRRLAFAAACFIVMLAAGFGVYTTLYETASVISIDINPSVELRLNSMGRVVSLTSYNDEGDVLLAGLDLRGKPYDKAIPALLQSEAMLPYLSSNVVLEFSVYSRNDEQGLLDYLTGQGEAVAASHPQLQVHCNGVGQNIVELAHQHGTTPGKMRALLELKELDPGIDFDEYAHHSMSEIHRLIGEHHGGGDTQGQSGGNGSGSDGDNSGGQGNGNDGGQGTGGNGNGHGHGSGQGHHGARDKYPSI